MKTELKVRLVGNNIKPEKISVKDFTSIALAYEKAIIGVLEKDNSIKKNDAFLSIVGVTNESLGLTFRSKHDWEDKILAATNKINTFINNNMVDELPSKTVESLISIQNIAKKNKCITKLTGNKNIVSTEFTGQKELHIKKRPPFKGEAMIYGKIIGIQADNPSLKLELLDGQKVSFNIKKSHVEKLSKSLLKTVRVKGIAIWNRDTYDVLDMKPDSFKIMEETSIKEGVKGLARLLGKYWKDRDPDEYVRSLRN